jgi:hypothetical protein
VSAEQQSIAAHVFARLRAIWGTRFMALWRGAEMAEVLSTWDEALAGVDRDRIARALADCQNADQPPTLPAFLALCRAQQTVADHQRRLPYVGDPTTPEQARRNLERIRAMLAAAAGHASRDPLRWARRPKSAQAVLLLARGAQSDYRLRAILLEHVDEGATRCRSEEAVQALLALMAAGVVDRLRGSEGDEFPDAATRAQAHFEEPA